MIQTLPAVKRKRSFRKSSTHDQVPKLITQTNSVSSVGVVVVIIIIVVVVVVVIVVVVAVVALNAAAADQLF